MRFTSLAALIWAFCSCTGIVQSIDGLDAGPSESNDGGPFDAGVVKHDPAWLTGRALNEWFEIPNTSGAAGQNADAYCGFGLRDSTSEIIIAAAGGHHDGASNAVVSLILADDAPKWVVRKASSTVTPEDVGYYPDGLPSSRHTYQSEHVIESLDRIFMFGARFTWGNSFTFPNVDGFNLTTNEWDPAGTWAPVQGGYGAVRVRGTEDVFTNGLAKWTAATQTWSTPITSRTNTPVRWPIAYDSLRNQLFTLQWGDGQGYDTGVNSSKIALSGTTQVDVTFNPSAAFTLFQAEAPAYAAMDYDPPHDRFLFYNGIDMAGAGRIYVITPNDTAVWDMSILALGPGTVTPAPAGGSGVNNRFRYVPELRGFVLLATKNTNLFFVRTSN